MAHTLTLTDGTTTLDLAGTVEPGYILVSFVPPRPTRLLTRTSGFPFADGNRTIASTLDDVAAELVVAIIGTDGDDLDARFQALVRLLDAAQRWETTRRGAPVRLEFKRQGVTASSFRVVTGVPLMPQPVEPSEITWLDLSSIGNDMTVAFTVTLEPVAHAGEAAAIVSETATNTPGDNIVTATAIAGTMPAPIVVSLSASGVTDPPGLSAYWLAQLDAAPFLYDATTIPLAGTLNGYDAFAVPESDGGFEIARGGWTVTSTAPLRAIIRVWPQSIDPGFVDFRFLIHTGNTSQAGPWVRVETGLTNSWRLVDLGALRLPSGFLSRIAMHPTTAVEFSVEARVVLSDPQTVWVDYVEVLPVRQLVKLSATIHADHVMHYDMAALDDTFVWPSSVHQAYVTDVGENLQQEVRRWGRLDAVAPGDTPAFWLAALYSGEVHVLADETTVAIDQLACYSLGLRGDA